MKLVRFIPLVLASLLFAAPTAHAQTKVAIVNPAKIFNDIQETKDVQAAMEQKGKTLQAQKFEKETKLKELQTARDSLKPDSAQYADRNKELMDAGIAYKVWLEVTQIQVQSEQKMQMKALFDKITNAVGDVATAKGLDVVIAEQRPQLPDSMDQLNLDQLRAILNSRNILFNTPQVDITNDVIAAMDAKYKSGK